MFRRLTRPALLGAILIGTAAAVSAADPTIDTKAFRIDCQRLEGNSQRGLRIARRPHAGFTAVLSDATHKFYNAPGKPGLRYWVVAGDVAQLKPIHRPVAAFGSRNQRVQLYGGLEADKLYTLFVTAGRPTTQSAAARTVFKARRCSPIGESAPIPNELRHTRPLHKA